MTATFKDAVVMVTGAASGIGRAVALRSAELGADLVLADIDAARLAAVHRVIVDRGGRAHAYTVDVGDRAAMTTLAGRVYAAHGHVDVLINNAGIGAVCSIQDMTIDGWERIVRVNYWGVVHGIRAFLPGMLSRGSGHIVNVASANGLFALPLGGVYASTKYAVVGLSEALRAELRRSGIGVTVVCPGLTRTAILEQALSGPDGTGATQTLARLRTILARRGVDPDRIARAITRAVRKDTAVVKVPLHVHVIDALHRFLPVLYRWAIARIPEERRPDR